MRGNRPAPLHNDFDPGLPRNFCIAGHSSMNLATVLSSDFVEVISGNQPLFIRNPKIKLRPMSASIMHSVLVQLCRR